MKIFVIIIGLIALAVIVFIIYRLITVKRQHRRLESERFERVRALYEKLESGAALSEADVFPYAENMLTRQTAFELLAHYKKTDLFPKEFYTLVKAAESSLANWLLFPTELDACPDVIEHIKRVSFDFDGQNNLVHYEVFKYRISEPHWAAKNGWILGVVGPYFDDSQPYDPSSSTFSRISSTLDKVSPEDEAKWVHEHISMKR